MALGRDNDNHPIASLSRDDILTPHPDNEVHLVGGTRADETASGIENLRLNSDGHRNAVLKSSPRHRVAEDQSIASGLLTAIPELQHSVLAMKKYAFRYMIAFRSNEVSSGVKATISAPSGATVIATVKSLFQADGGQALWAGAITSSLDVVTSPSVPEAFQTYLLEIDGVVAVDTTSGILQPMLANKEPAVTLTIDKASFGTVTEVE